jgi:glycosyltransferase involved in cell wall biosynthesis
MATPLVSVLMTAYNREKYIAEAIESVLASTFQDFELIIVDDCSRDHTVEIVRRYTSDPRLQVHVNEKNLGDYPNRNRAASLAKGQYLKYVDSDDYIYPRGLQIMVEMFEPFTEAAVGFCSFAQVSERPYPFQLSPREAYQYSYFNRTHSIFSRASLSSVIRRDKFETVGGFTGKRMVGDFEMWHILAARFPVVLLPDGIVWNREHPAQEIQDFRNRPSDAFTYNRISIDYLQRPECPLLPDERKRALKMIRRGQARRILREIAHCRGGTARKLLAQSALKPAQIVPTAFSRV